MLARLNCCVEKLHPPFLVEPTGESVVLEDPPVSTFSEWMFENDAPGVAVLQVSQAQRIELPTTC